MPTCRARASAGRARRPQSRRRARAWRRADDHLVSAAHQPRAPRQVGARANARQQVPPPPPNVPSCRPTISRNDGLTLRQRLEQHRSKPECASCHNRHGPAGLRPGEFRRHRPLADRASRATPSTPRASCPSGEKFNGPAELKNVLLGTQGRVPEQFVAQDARLCLGPRAQPVRPVRGATETHRKPLGSAMATDPSMLIEQDRAELSVPPSLREEVKAGPAN